MRPRSLMAGAFAGVVIASLFTAPISASAASNIVELPISFKVKNTNSTAVRKPQGIVKVSENGRMYAIRDRMRSSGTS